MTVRLLDWEGQPDIRPIGAGLYALKADYMIFIERVETKERFAVKVPEGFQHDGASIPRLLWTITGITPDGLIRAAALIHDWLYAAGGMCCDKAGGFFWFSRKEADQLFLELMREAGVSKCKRKSAWLGVRVAGWAFWRTGPDVWGLRDKYMRRMM